MYSDICLVVKLDGDLSKSFSIIRSVHQGCLLSPAMYMLAPEPLLKMLDILRGVLHDLGLYRQCNSIGHLGNRGEHTALKK